MKHDFVIEKYYSREEAERAQSTYTRQGFTVSAIDKIYEIDERCGIEELYSIQVWYENKRSGEPNGQ